VPVEDIGAAIKWTAAAAEPPLDAAPTPRRRQWADLMRRSFGFDVLACDRCGARLRLIALIHQADVIGRILTHLGAPTDLPTAQPARSPPHARVFADN
jgi:hypothetical protein